MCSTKSATRRLLRVTAARRASPAHGSRSKALRSSRPTRSSKMPNDSSRVALIQMQCGPEPEANFAKAVDRVREAAQQGAQIICLPELFRSQYFCQSEDHANFALAEEIPGPSTEQLGAVARESG